MTPGSSGMEAGVIELVMMAALAAGGSAEQDQACAQWAESNRKVMAARQDGVAAEELLRRMGPDIDDLVRRAVVAAYSRPRVDGADRKSREIGDFGDRAFVECMSAR